MINKAPCLFYNRAIFYAEERFSGKYQEKDTLNPSQQHILLFLNQRPQQDISLRELEQVLNLSQTGTAKLTTQLKAGGWVTKYTDENDKRMKRICITEKGKKYCDEKALSIAEAEEKLLEGMNQDERVELERLLEIAYRNSSKIDTGELVNEGQPSDL
jgi:DNA-binding MarR family transcriptional regulator